MNIAILGPSVQDVVPPEVFSCAEKIFGGLPPVTVHDVFTPYVTHHFVSVDTPLADSKKRLITFWI